MTVEPAQSRDVQSWADYGSDLDDGLGDINQSDLQIPRLSIVGKHATFKDSTTKVEFATLNAVFLGVVKQRVMWDAEVEDGDKPQCKSPNNELGFPQMRTDIDESKQFPWADSNFNESEAALNEEGLVTLPCEDCCFSEWTKKGSKSVKPRCSEQLTVPLYYFLDDDPNPYPAIISFQRSGIKAARTYAASFKAQRQPMFTVMTTVTLTAESRGSVDYCTPNFMRGDQTSAEQWREYSQMYAGVREMLHEPPRTLDSESEKESESAPAAAASPPPAKSTPPPARKPPSAAAATALKPEDPWQKSESSIGDTDGLPF